MALMLSAKIIITTLSVLLAKTDDLAFIEAKKVVIEQYNHHNAERDLGSKATQFEISETGFIRYRKTDVNNKSEYFSVKLTEFKGLKYLGDEQNGWLLLNFNDESVIYQTYNDKTGNVDEMLSEIKIPLKDVNIDELNQLDKAMNKLKNFK